MALTITLNLPAELESRLRRIGVDLDADVTQAYALELFRSGRISHADLAAALGIDRFETDAFLKRHLVFDRSPTMADLDADRTRLDRVMGRADR